MPGRSRENLIALDLLRCAAALMVVAYHMGAALPHRLSWQVVAMAHDTQIPDRATASTWWGWVGVEIFFVVSGLVIARSAAGVSAVAFLRRRALRLAPAVWICASITFAALAVGAPQLRLGAVWLESMLFVPTDHPIDPSYWTLSLELAFYLLVAVRLTGGNQPDRLERLAIVLGGASALYLATAALLAFDPESFRFNLSLLPHGCLFAAGVMIAGCWREGWTARRLGWLAVMFSAAAIEIVRHAQATAISLGIDPARWPPLVCFAAAMAIALAAPRLQPFLDRHLGWRWPRRAGLATYPLYLLHQVVGAAVAIGLMRRGVDARAAALAAVALTIALAWWIAARVEPVLRARMATTLDTLTARRRGPRRDSPASASLPAG